MRGGTSKCWLFSAADLDVADADAVLSAAFGSGDPRQLDGVGGATSTTSKAAIVRPSADPAVDVEYLFAQVGIGARQVEWSSNCGNCATAIGLYALLEGLVPARPGQTVVRLKNINTGVLLAATIATPGGTVPETGTATVPGAAVGGVPVELTFLDPAGGTTGRLLPTGRPLDRLPEPATLVDAGAPAALLDAAAFGMTGGESLELFLARLPELVAVRRRAALAMGLSGPDDPVEHAIPKTGVVGPPVRYRTSDGVLVEPGEYDLAVRMVSMLNPHPAVGLTSAVAIAAAAGVAGGVVSDALGGRLPELLRLGTPAGVVTVRTERDTAGTLRSVGLRRAARRIATAEISVPVAQPLTAATA